MCTFTSFSYKKKLHQVALCETLNAFCLPYLGKIRSNMILCLLFFVLLKISSSTHKKNNSKTNKKTKNR